MLPFFSTFLSFVFCFSWNILFRSFLASCVYSFIFLFLSIFFFVSSYFILFPLVFLLLLSSSRFFLFHFFPFLSLLPQNPHNTQQQQNISSIIISTKIAYPTIDYHNNFLPSSYKQINLNIHFFLCYCILSRPTLPRTTQHLEFIVHVPEEGEEA